MSGDQLKEVYPSIWEMGYWKSEERYLSLFEDAKGYPVVGEASQNYARLPRVTGVPERIAKFNPDARFLYIIRDPIKRTISHYWYMVDHYGEGRSLFDAVTKDPDYTGTSHYAMQLAPYIRMFGLDRIKILTLENLRDEPQQTMQDVYSWLGVDAGFVPPTLDRQYNAASEETHVTRGFGILHRLRYSRVWSHLGPATPASIRKIGRGLAEKPVMREDISTAEIENWLRPLQIKQTEELIELTGREFPEWRTLYAHSQ